MAYSSDSSAETYCSTCRNGVFDHQEVLLANLGKSGVQHVHLPGDATFKYDIQEPLADEDILKKYPCIKKSMVKLERMNTSEQGINDLVQVFADEQKIGFYTQYLYQKRKDFPEANFDYKMSGIAVNELGLLSKNFPHTHPPLNTVELHKKWSPGGVDYGQKRIAKSEIVLVLNHMKTNIRKFFSDSFIFTFNQIHLKRALETSQGKHKTQKQFDSVIHSAFSHAMRYLMEVKRPEEFQNVDQMHEALERCLFMVRYYAKVDKNIGNTPEQQLFASICIPCYNAAILLVFNLKIPTQLTPLNLLVNFKDNRINSYKVARVDQRNINSVCPSSSPNLLPFDEWGPFHYTEKEKIQLRKRCTGHLYSKNKRWRTTHPLSRKVNLDQMSGPLESDTSYSDTDLSDDDDVTDLSVPVEKTSKTNETDQIGHAQTSTSMILSKKRKKTNEDTEVH